MNLEFGIERKREGVITAKPLGAQKGRGGRWEWGGGEDGDNRSAAEIAEHFIPNNEAIMPPLLLLRQPVYTLSSKRCAGYGRDLGGHFDGTLFKIERGKTECQVIMGRLFVFGEITPAHHLARVG